MITTSDLIKYLDELLYLAKNDALPDDMKRTLTLLYMNKLYQNEEEEDMDKKLSYISLGWYIHNFLLTTK